MTPIVQAIRRLKVSSFSDLLRHESIVQRLRIELFDRAESLKSEVASCAQGGSNIWLPMADSDLRSASRGSLITTVHKLALFSDRPVVEIPAVRFPALGSTRHGKSRDNESRKLRRFWDLYIEPMLALEEVLWHGLVTVVPSALNRRILISPELRKSFEIISLSNKTLRANLQERPEGAELTRGLMLYLPHLSNLPTEALADFRGTNANEYQAFHHAVRSFFAKSPGVDSEAKLLALMEEVDYQVRKLEEAMNAFARSSALKIGKVVSGIVAVSLTMVAPPYFAAMLFKALGGMAAFSGVWEWIESRERLSALKNDFYMPWYLDKLSKQYEQSEKTLRRLR